MASDSLKDLNPEQLKAVTTTEGPLLIIAGAGTGKTAVIARRIAYIIEKKLADPSEILALTFTDKAANEMQTRVDITVPYGFFESWIYTFHAFGDRILRENALEIGLDPTFKILSKPDQILFVKQHLFEFELDYYRPLSNPYKFIDAMLSLISRAKDDDITPEEYLTYARTIKDLEEQQKQFELGNFFAKYEKLKYEASLLDYSDQITTSLQLFRRRKNILEKYQQKFKYLLVDEYQDTNYAQNELVKILAEKSGNVCVVGDDDQSIYKFRGAAISNILQFKKHYPKTVEVVLTKNYRSTQLILDASYKLINHNNPNRLEIENNINKKLLSTREEKGLEPRLIFGETLSEETDLVAHEVKFLVEEKGLNYRDIAILIRANNDAQAFIQALNMLDIPSQFVGSRGLYDRSEIKSLISLLTALTTFDDNLNIYSLAISELYEISPDTMIALNDISRRSRESLYKTMSGDAVNQIEAPDDVKEKVAKLCSDVGKFMKISTKESVTKTLYMYIVDTGYLKKLKEKDTVEAEEKIANIAKFLDRIKEFEDVTNSATVLNFIEFLQIMRSSGENPAMAQIDTDLDAVNLMTIHSAKGLEYRAVFLVNLVVDKFPVRDRSEPIPVPDALIKESLPQGNFHLQEERRLFYVGLTRAQDYLYLTYAKDYGGKRTRKVSPFVLETMDVTQVEGMPQKSSALEKIERFKPVKDGQMIFDFENKRFLIDDRIIDLSRMDIESYLSCALQYWYGHVARLSVPKSFNLVYGIALHKAVEQFYLYKTNGRLIELADLLMVLEKSWVSEGFISEQHEKLILANAKKVLANFYKREKSVEVKNLEVEKTFKFIHKNIIVKGRIDYLQQGNIAKILDFKSTLNVDEKDALDKVKKSIQLKIYTLAYFKDKGKLPDEIGIYFLDNGLISTIKPSQQTINEAQSALEIAATGIRTGNFEANPKEGTFTCNFCSFKDICPFSLAKI